MSTNPDGVAVDVGVSDAELFSGAMANEVQAETPVTEQAKEPETEGQPRNPDGTFAAKAAETEKPEPAKPEAKPAVADAADDPDKAAQIPSWRLREEREAKAEALKALEAEKAERTKLATEFANMQRQLAELRKPAEKKPEDEPDPLLDPQGFREHMRREFQEQLLGERREMSLRLAHRTYKEAFDEAYAAAQQAMASGDRALAARMQATCDPGETLIAWHREQKTMKEVGGDPAAYRTKLLEEALKDPAYLAKAIEAAKASAAASAANGQDRGARPAVQLPPSLSNAARADAHENPADLDMSSEGLFRHAMK
jgi:hypothetical protein